MDILRKSADEFRTMENYYVRGGIIIGALYHSIMALKMSRDPTYAIMLVIPLFVLFQISFGRLLFLIYNVIKFSMARLIRNMKYVRKLCDSYLDDILFQFLVGFSWSCLFWEIWNRVNATAICMRTDTCICPFYKVAGYPALVVKINVPAELRIITPLLRQLHWTIYFGFSSICLPLLESFVLFVIRRCVAQPLIPAGLPGTSNTAYQQIQKTGGNADHSRDSEDLENSNNQEYDHSDTETETNFQDFELSGNSSSSLQTHFENCHILEDLENNDRVLISDSSLDSEDLQNSNIEEDGHSDSDKSINTQECQTSGNSNSSHSPTSESFEVSEDEENEPVDLKVLKSEVDAESEIDNSSVNSASSTPTKDDVIIENQASTSLGFPDTVQIPRYQTRSQSSKSLGGNSESASPNDVSWSSLIPKRRPSIKPKKSIPIPETVQEEEEENNEDSLERSFDVRDCSVQLKKLD